MGVAVEIAKPKKEAKEKDFKREKEEGLQVAKKRKNQVTMVNINILSSLISWQDSCRMNQKREIVLIYFAIPQMTPKTRVSRSTPTPS